MIETYGIPQLTAAVAVTLGAVTAVGARLPRLAILGLLVALLGGPLVTRAVPDPLSVTPRVIGAVLAAYLLWIAVRDAPAGTFRGAAVGWAGVATLGGVAFAAGLAVALGLLGEAGAVGTGADGSSPDATAGLAAVLPADPAAASGGLAAAAAIAVLAMAPALFGRDVLRTGLGLLLLIAAVDLGRDALGSVSDRVVDVASQRGVALAFAIATVTTAAAVAWLTWRVLAERHDLSPVTRHAGRAPLGDGRGDRP